MTMGQLANVNVLCRLMDVCRDIDRCLDMRDLGGFTRASREFRDIMTGLRALIDTISVADITSHAPPSTAGAAPLG